MTILAGSTCLVGAYLCFAGSSSDGGIIRRELSASSTTMKQSTKRLQRRKKNKGRVLADDGEVAKVPSVGNIVTSTPHRQTHTLELLLGSNRSPHTFAISTGLDVPLLLPCARCNGCSACPETTDADFAGKIDDVDDVCYDPAASDTAVFTECSTCPSSLHITHVHPSHQYMHQCGANTGGMCLSTSTIGSTITNEKGFVQDGIYTAMEVTDIATLLFNQADNSFKSRSSAREVGKKDSVTLPIAIDCLSQAEGFAAQNLGAYGDVDGDGDEKDDVRWRGAGLVGMSAAPTSFLSMLVEEGIISNRRFGLCFDRMSFGVVLSDKEREADGIADDQMGRNDNIVSLGDIDRAYLVTPLVYARNSALAEKENQNNRETTTKASYAVRLRKVYLRQGDIESAASIGEGPVPSLASIGNDYGEDATVYGLDQVDYDRINGGVNGSLPGVSVDTELSYTYFDRALEKDFIGAFEAMSGRKFSYLGMELTNEEVRTLPTVLLQLEADNAEQTGVDPSTIPGMAAYRNLDNSNPFDVVIAIPPSHYLKYDHTTDRFSIKFFVSIEDPSGISRLGSNIFQGHELLFDVDEGRIGFAEHDGCVGGADGSGAEDTGARLFGTADRSSRSPSITDSFVSSVSNLFGGDDSENSLSSPVETKTDAPANILPRSLVAPTTSSNVIWAVIGCICFLLGIGVVLAVDGLVERRARANDDVVSEEGTAEMNTIGSGDRSIGIPERSTRDIFDYQEEMRGRGRSVGVSDIELEQERMRASFTSVASGDGGKRSDDDGQQRASFGASRTLRWKLDH